MISYSSQTKSAVFAAVVLSTCLIFGAANAAGPKAATAKQKAAWENEWTEKVGIQLEYDFDSSGPDAWDSKKHPSVFITTEGPGYGGLLSGVTLPGLAIIDADTREVVASQSFDVLSWGWKNVFEPHGLGVSPDGKWIYLPTGEGSFTTTTGGHAGRFLVINARTLKIDKVIQLSGQAHHAKSYTSPEGEQRVMLYGWSQPLFVLDPDNDNRAVGSISHQEQGSEGYLYFASSNGDQIIGTGRYRDFDMRKHLTDNPIWIIDPQSWHIKKFINVPDSAPVWVNFTSDDKYAYITGARNSIVMKLDLEKGKVTTEQRAGVDGPYGNHFGWDDRYIYTIGKGEESHNRGKMLGMVDTATMEVPGSRAMDQFYTGCVRGDHGTLHPDPEANELWISCNASFEVVVFDLDLKDVSARIPLPNGGSTHSGAFVFYPDGWQEPGQTLSDMNGLHGSALDLKRRIVSGEF
jgi:DNA-binding beta-propeller fold protein YncE